MGDQGRRGWLQNLPNGPFLTAPFQDDTFGGARARQRPPSGVILRLNDDGTAPTDNPFFAVGAGDRRRSGLKYPEDLLLRAPQRLRHGIRSVLGLSLGYRERRRCLQ